MNELNENIIKRAEKQANKLKIEKVTATEDFILIEGIVECKVYFAFYKHFIVCSGDYGEWQFDCTWETVQNKKPKIPTNIYYLCSKASRKCKHIELNEDLFMQEFKEWWEETKEEYKHEENFEELEELVEDFYCEDEYRYISKIDNFVSDFNHLTNHTIDEYIFYEMGNEYNIQFLINAYMLQKIREYFERS